MDVLSWVVTAAGGLVVLTVLRDIFATIFHPGGRGRLTHVVMAAVWRSGRGGPRWIRRKLLTGPLSMLAVVLVWVLLLVAGWALVYGPHLPEAFSYSSGLAPAERSNALDALYVSAVTLATLGFGDVVPQATWLRVVMPVEALIGFALITAAVSWVQQVYPALNRRRTLAVRVDLLRCGGAVREIDAGRPAVAAAQLADLADGLAGLRMDLVQNSETYYFRDGDAPTALPAMLGVVLDLSERARRSGDSELAYVGTLLGLAAEEYLKVVDEQFLHVGGSARERCAAYAADNGQPVLGLG